MKSFVFATALAVCCTSSLVQAVDVILAGGVALRQWEELRGPQAHDRWWANFIRASTMHMARLRAKDAKARITWIVYQPAYAARGKADGKPYVAWIEDNAKRYGAELVWFRTSEEMYRAINNTPRGKDKVKSFYYFGHSNAYAFMLDYSCDIIGVSKVWIHQSDLAKYINPAIFAPQADCWSFGCYTGNSMSKVWKASFGVSLWGNTEATRYQPLSSGRMPEGNGKWVD
ncbi:MAG: hypothetical protein R3Y56_00245 [Akkermansia sp.]